MSSVGNLLIEKPMRKFRRLDEKELQLKREKGSASRVMKNGPCCKKKKS